jgi:DNA-binding MarR family transcriptional regulator
MDRNRTTDELASAAFLSEDLRRVLHRLSRRLRREAQDLAVSPLHALLLAAIRENPGIGVKDLARLERLRGPTISGHVKAMEALGLIERGPSDPNDRRRVRLVVAKKGIATLEGIKRSRVDWLARRLANLSPKSMTPSETRSTLCRRCSIDRRC